MKTIFLFLSLTVTATLAFAQPQTREQLEKQRQELKKEIEQTEKLLQKNKKETRESLSQWRLVNKKVNLQSRVVDNLNKDLRVINNNLYTIQLEINRYNRLLDTLKQEYAKSMVYAYKNRSNQDFLNFIFSANSFNDAIKRIAYLKSYRNYRELQGENILRTQELRKKKLAELNSTRQKKNINLKEQSAEMKQLAEEQKEKDRILGNLKKQGKDLNNRIAAKQRQMKKVNSAITAAIKKAQEEARREARLRAEREKSEAAKNAPVTASGAKEPAKPSTRNVRKPGESILLNEGNYELNASFERNKGSLPWPVDRGTVLMPYGLTTLPSGARIENTAVTIASDIGSPVKTIFSGTVHMVQQIEDIYVVMVQHGRYFTVYSNLMNVNVSKGDEIKTGQTIGRVGANLDGVGTIDFMLQSETVNYNPETWMKKR